MHGYYVWTFSLNAIFTTLCNPRKVCNDVRKRLSFLQIRKINSRDTLAFYTWDATCNPFRPYLETDYHVLIESC